MGRTRRNWTTEEDEALRKAVSIVPNDRALSWRELAKSVPGRSNKDCRRRWWNSLADSTAKGTWTEEEDERLIEAVKEHGPNWARIATDVASRNSDQCSSHWIQVLDPNINYSDWTVQEDEHLLHAVLSHGTNWSTIASTHTPKRTTLALKNRYSTLRLRNNNGQKRKRGESGEPSGARRPSPTSKATSSRAKTSSAQASLTHSRRTSLCTAREEESYDDDDDDDEYEDDDVEVEADFPPACRRRKSSDKAPLIQDDLGFQTPSTVMLGPTRPASSSLSTSIMPDMCNFQQIPPVSYNSCFLNNSWTDSDLFGTGYGLPQSPYTMSDTIHSPTTLDNSRNNTSSNSPEAFKTSTQPFMFDSSLEATNMNTRQTTEPMTDLALQRLGSSDNVLAETDNQMSSFRTPIQPSSSGNHRVYIELICEAPELQTVLMNVASTGRCLNLKIEPSL